MMRQQEQPKGALEPPLGHCGGHPGTLGISREEHPMLSPGELQGPRALVAALPETADQNEGERARTRHRDSSQIGIQVPCVVRNPLTQTLRKRTQPNGRRMALDQVGKSRAVVLVVMG